MTAQAVVEAFIDGFNRMDLEGSYALLSDGIVYHNIPMQPVTGTAGVRAFLDQMPFDAAEWIVHAIAANGDKVLTERTDRFRIGGRWIEVRVMGTFEVHDGLITAWRDYFDLQQFLAQVNPPPDAQSS